MKSFAFGFACGMTLAYLFSTHEALPVIAAWALSAWVRQQELQKSEFSCEEDCECECEDEEEVVDESAVESDEDPAQSAVVPPPLP